MTAQQRQERILFELRHLRWKALNLGYSMAELEQHLSALCRRLPEYDVGEGADAVRALIADFRTAMAVELSH